MSSHGLYGTKGAVVWRCTFFYYSIKIHNGTNKGVSKKRVEEPWHSTYMMDFVGGIYVFLIKIKQNKIAKTKLPRIFIVL
jgi:hypothetical protein